VCNGSTTGSSGEVKTRDVTIIHVLFCRQDRFPPNRPAAKRVMLSDSATPPEEYRTPAKVFGEKIGVAFQLIDDVIDLAAAEQETA
jgi:hypothetical protein